MIVYIFCLKILSFIYRKGTKLCIVTWSITVLFLSLSLSASAATTYSGSDGVRLKLLTSNSVSACSNCHFNGGTGPNFTLDYAAFSTYATTYHIGVKTDAVQRMIDRTSLAVGVGGFMPDGGLSQISNVEKALLAAWKANFAVDVDTPTAMTLTPPTGNTKVVKTTNDSAQFTVYANVDDSGIDATNYVIEYGLTATPSFSSASQVVGGSGGGVGTTQISQQLSSLNCSATYHYRVKASNTSFTSTGSWQEENTLACNTAPVFQSTPFSPSNATEDTLFQFDVVALDGEDDDVRYSLANEPVGMSINDTSGRISWTPLEGIVTSGLVTVRAHDNALNLTGVDGAVAASETFTVAVDAINDAPLITSTSSTSAIESSLYSYQVVVDDPDDAGVGLSYDVSPKTGDMNISASGLLTWTPANGISSSGSITVTATDGGENSAAAASQIFIIIVTGVNTSPSITTSAPTTATEDILYQYSVGVLDLDDDNNGSDIYFVLANQPSGMVVSATGVITWPPLEGQGDANNIQLTVTDDGENGAIAAIETFSITVTSVNDAPQITSSASISAIESNLYSYQVVVNDPDDSGLELAYQLNSFPTGMSISTLGLVNWTPGNGVLTSGVVAIEVSDGGENSAAVALQSFTITVNGVNTAPTISSSGGTSAVEDIEYQYAVQVVDADDINNGTDITFSLANTPNGMEVSTTGLITWTPSEGQGDANNIQITVADGGENSVAVAIETFSISVTSINDAPEITSSASTSAIESNLYSYQIVVSDPDDAGLELAYQLNSFPPGMSISTLGLITWTPGNGIVTSGVVSIEVSDGGENSAAVALQSFTITVNGVNTAPTISSTSSTSAVEDIEYQYAVQVVDADDINNGTDITFTLTNNPSGMEVSATGLITWTPSEGQGDANNIQITVADGGENSVAVAIETFSISVTSVNDAPQITSSASTSAIESNLYSYQVVINDPDDSGLELAYQLSSFPAGMSISTLGLVNWTPGNGVLTSGVVSIEVSDGGENSAAVALQSFTITVNGVNTAPTISSTGGTSAVEDIEYQYAVQVVDADDINNGTDITFTLTNTPSGMEVSATGLITWTPSEGQGDANNIQITVADGGENSVSAAIETFSITVTPINDPPIITSSSVLFAIESQVYNYQLTFNDPDDALSELTFQLITQPSGMTLSNAGLISWTPDNGVDDSGLVTVRVSDGGENNALPAEQSFTISITAVNTQPMILSTALTTAIEDQLYQYVLVVVDEDDDDNGTDITYSLDNAPASMQVSTTGIITWLPLEGQGAVENIQITVADGGEDGALADTELFSLTVAAVNDAPQLAAISNQAMTELETLEIDLGSLASDVDDENNGTDLIWSLTNNPLGMLIDNEGQLSWLSSENTAATYTINVHVADGGEDSVSAAVQSFQLMVNLLDRDADSIADYNDNCVALANTDQLNSDDDSLGNVCDDDDDNDTIPDVVEVANNLDPLNPVDATLDSDGDGEINSAEQQQCFLNDESENNLCDQILRDTVAPEITTNGNQQRISTGYLTSVELVASAFDIKDGDLVATADTLGPFRPGKHVVTWQAQDTQGNATQAEQQVSIIPLVRFTGYQQVTSNQAVTIPVSLSGAAIDYPVVIDFDVSGTATEEDHDLSAGQIIINEGEQGEITFNTLVNESLASNKSIVVNLQQSNDFVHLGEGLSYQVDLMITNVAPAVELKLTQNSLVTQVIYQDQGNFILTANVEDANGDDLTVNWLTSSTTSTELFNLSEDVFNYTFDTNAFSIGFYSIQLSVTDGDLQDVKSLAFRIETQAPVLTNEDSDDDGIADDLEGLADTDGDGIQDYLDPINDVQYMHKNLLSNDLFETANQLLVTEEGLILKVGQIAIEYGKTGVGLAASDLTEIDSGSVSGSGRVNNSEEEKYIIGEIFDFEIHGISAQQPQVKIVIPLATAIPINAEYWKYDGNSWYAFDTSAEDYLATAFKQEGTCPDTESDHYRIGLIPFTQCLLLSIADGGVNDSDGSINGVVTDPGAIVMDSFFELNPQQNLIKPSSSQGAGAASIGFIILLLLSVSYRVQGAEVEQQTLLSATIGTDDNVSQAESKVDIIADHFAHIDARFIIDYEIDFNKTLSLEVQAGQKAYKFTRQLGRNEFSGRLVYRWQNNFSYNSPWYQIFSDIKIWDSKTQQRNSTFYTQQAMVSARLTTKISGSIGAEHKVRNSESRVFDLSQSRLFTHLDYTWTDDFSLYSSYSYIKGDTVSTVQNKYCNGLIATSVYPLLLVSKDIEWDQVFNDSYCGNWISYRLNALTQTFVLGANYGFDHSSSLDFSWLYADVQAEGDNYYQRNSVQLNFLKAF